MIMIIWYFTIVFWYIIGHAATENGDKTVYLGALFDDTAISTDLQEKLASFLDWKSADTGLTFKLLTETINSGDSFDSRLKVCSFLDQRTIAIFGPTNEENINTVQSICDHKEIVHIITRWVDASRDYHSVINFYPSSALLNKAYYDIVIAWKWKSFTVYYEDNESLLRISELITRAKNDELVVVVKQLDESGENNYRKSLKEGLLSGETRYVIDCRIEILEDVLIQAQQVGMMTSNFKYFITNLNLDTLDLESFQYSDANLTGIRLVNREYDTLKEYGFNEDDKKLRTEEALLFDALASVVRALIEIPEIINSEDNTTGCDNFNCLRHGTTLINRIWRASFEGLTGRIEFNNERKRGNFYLDVIELHENGIQKVGMWNASNELRIDRPLGSVIDDDPSSLRNKSFVVITTLTEPYGMLKVTSDKLEGNERFEGFAIDLIHELSLLEGFNYTFTIREDKFNGKKLANGSWSGMIGDVRDGNADLAITDLTITAEREEAVDFTHPFMTLGISILAKKPEKAPPSFFSFADPFALDTWVMMSISYVIVSLSFFVMGRICADEWTNPYPCIEEPEFLINQFNLKNSFWWAVGSLMQQGTELAPVAISTRMATGMWWFFVLIMVSSYTASLAAFLTTENELPFFKDIETLVNNKYNVKMGAKLGGATASFFEGQDDEIYKKVAEYMAEHPEEMVRENSDGVKKAEDENYAFFMESASIEYETQRHCDLKSYGEWLDEKGYGIAMKKNSSYRFRLSTAVLKLSSSGKIAELRRKWWEEQRGGGQCTGKEKTEEAPPLGLKNIEGVFYVTLGGTALAIVIVIIEFLMYTWRGSRKAKITFREAFRMEMKAYLNFSSDVKPTFQAKSDSKSGNSSGSPPQECQGYNNNFSYGFIPSIVQESMADDR